jgi:diacylglycerol kinase family enzyme
MDDQIVRVRASEVIVTNATHLKNSNFTLGSPEDLSDGCLDVYIITARNLLDYLNLAWQTLFSARDRASKLKSFEISSSITIETPGSAFPVQADGEALGTTPVTVDLLPAALQVIVPKNP